MSIPSDCKHARGYFDSVTSVASHLKASKLSLAHAPDYEKVVQILQ